MIQDLVITDLLSTFAFERAWALWLLLPWLLFWLWLRGVQVRALRWIGGHVAPRFRGIFSAYTPASFRLHMGILLATGTLLVAAAAGPSFSGRAEVVTGGRLLVVLDASSSMAATDVEALEVPEGVEAPESRFEVARYLAGEIVRRLEGHEAALETFSGTVALQVPMTADRAVFENALEGVRLHNPYHLTGSSFRAVLDSVLRFGLDVGEDPESASAIHVVLLSDGEQPFEEDYSEALDAVSERGIPVHTLAVGSLEGQGRRILDLKDIWAKKEEPREIVKFHTRRVDEHLERISEATGGRFALASLPAVEALVSDIRDRPLGGQRVSHAEARNDLSPWLLAAAAVLFLIDTLFVARPPSPYESFTFRFDLGRVGSEPAPVRRRPSGAALAVSLGVLLLNGCETSPLQKAHRENERGIALDAREDYASARPHYERSIAYGVRAEVPTYNLARSLTLQESFGEAHEHNEKALLLAPDLLPAAYNDGIDLYAWGRSLYDPKGCNLERTFDLWQGSLRRFEDVLGASAEGTVLAEKARRNRDALVVELDAVETLMADPPPECEEPPPPPPPPSPDEPPPPPPPPDEPPPPEEQPPPPPEGQPPPPPPPDEPPPPGEPPPSAGTPPPLTPEERGQIEEELQRIAQESAGKPHHRSRQEQYRDGDVDSIPEKVWW